jgi:hypothetical protein
MCLYVNVCFHVCMYGVCVCVCVCACVRVCVCGCMCCGVEVSESFCTGGWPRYINRRRFVFFFVFFLFFRNPYPLRNARGSDCYDQHSTIVLQTVLLVMHLFSSLRAPCTLGDAHGIRAALEHVVNVRIRITRDARGTDFHEWFRQRVFHSTVPSS